MKKPAPKKGKFIVIDGGEGSGKSTVVKAFAELFPDEQIVITREPGGSPLAEDIRTIMLNHPLSGQAAAETQFALVWAGRFDHLKNLVEPTLKKGTHVFSDRFDSTTYAYQLHGQEAMHLKELFWKVRELYLRETTPDLYVFFDLPPEEGMKRVALRKGETNHFDSRKMDFHKRARAGFQEFLQHVPHIVINANQPLEAVKRDFAKAVKAFLKEAPAKKKK